MLSVLSVIYAECHLYYVSHNEALFAKCRFAEFRYAECHGALLTIDLGCKSSILGRAGNCGIDTLEQKWLELLKFDPCS
jgi:hypothetical protein